MNCLMASPGGASSATSQIQNSGSESADLQQIMDQRKRKRMISNRESARRSRMRKQKHFDDLMAQLGQLANEKSHITTNINLTTQLYLNVEAENSILRAQMAELSHRLQSLDEIIDCMNKTNFSSRRSDAFEADDGAQRMMMMMGGDDFLNPWNLLHLNRPIRASADAYLC